MDDRTSDETERDRKRELARVKLRNSNLRMIQTTAAATTAGSIAVGLFGSFSDKGIDLTRLGASAITAGLCFAAIVYITTIVQPEEDE